ncbi:MAG: ribose-5-phosphate isomerase [Candidatus Woykebacteria bacterium RBG_16_43_9]|uniref:Ribose-5-phosphate isomerase n=1 Tax=Candidatus Woykebacteria bacterium RBG_16_43_9 TaxID=1802596 RepID=A0A1G1WFN0_9BACT|nr:MAG: ribose-5-phosphate isomerase [Candidatus Woykebacteria bacterium RBG_16_43_9]
MIYLASDHAGFELKESIKTYLKSKGYDVEDMGSHQLDPGDDYPDLIYPAAKKVSETPDSKGIIFGKSGQGEAMVANKVPGIRAAVYYGGPSTRSGLEIVKLSREHNDANILSIGAGFVFEEEAKNVVEKWLNTEFSGEDRHARRIQKISKLEDG